MKERSILGRIGIIIYIIMTGIDRFVYGIPSAVYIPVALFGIVLILVGFFKDKAGYSNQGSSQT